MQNFVKGAQFWNDYYDKILDPVFTQPPDFIMDPDEEPKSPDSPGRPGWELRPADPDSDDEMEDGEEAEMEWHTVPVDRDGWRYEEIDPYYGDDLEATLLLIGKQEADLVAYQCAAWRTPWLSITLNFDCEYGILVNHNADLKYKEGGKIIRSSQRWSDLSWRLWTTVCPKEFHNNLQYIIQETITNEDTTAALTEAATARGRLNPQNPKASHLVSTVYTPVDLDFTLGTSTEPTCDQEKGECDFYSILRTPNVIGVPYLLMDHADTLLYPYISEIITQSVLRGTDRTGWNLVIKLDSLPCDE